MQVQKLVALGGKVWERGDMKRVYFNYEELAAFYGLEYNGFGFKVDGEKVSNNSGRIFMSALRNGKFWFDLNTGKFSSRGMSDRMTEKLIERITEAVDALTSTQAEEEAVVEAPAEARQPAAVGATVRTATGQGIQSRPTRTNKFGGYCVKCGEYVRAGEGVTYHIDPDEAYEHSGWIVEHRGGCQ